MLQYLQLVENVLTNGERRQNRTGVDTLQVFGTQTRYELWNGFPLLTTKKVLFQAVVAELLWMLSGSTNIDEKLPRLGGMSLRDLTPIWNAWADERGDIGPGYGKQFRDWPLFRLDVDGTTQNHYGVDQIQCLLDDIKENPDSRRLIINLWNVAYIPSMKLPPCHMMAQFNVVRRDGVPYWLDCQMYQRSADIALGVPFNIASYALLMHLIARECNLVPRYFVHTIGDAHIYVNHVDGLRRQLTRTPRELPQLVLNPDKYVLDDFMLDDISVENYIPHPFIRFEVAV